MKKNKEKRASSLNSLLRVLTVVLFGVLVAFFVKTQADIDQMEEQLRQTELQVIQQKIYNQDLEMTLQDQQTLLERTAREKLDYAHPEERVFEDASGVK